MKIRNHRKKEWWFFPPDDSKLKLKRTRCYIFKYKSKLMSFLNSNLGECINGEVRLEESSFGHSGCIRMWTVWYNEREYEAGADIKADLRQELSRGGKYVFKPSKISKANKRYFAFSDKIIHLMCNIEENDGTILSSKANKLVELFKKRGFKDFEPSEDDQNYIDYYIANGIDFFHWSDRCNWLRTKTIIEYFKYKNLLK